MSRLYQKTDRPLTKMLPFLTSLVESNVESPFVLIAFIDLYEQNAKQKHIPVDAAAFVLCDELARKQDTIRQKYWYYRKNKLEKLNLS